MGYGEGGREATQHCRGTSGVFCTQHNIACIPLSTTYHRARAVTGKEVWEAREKR